MALSSPLPPSSSLLLFLFCNVSLLFAVGGLNSDGTALLSFKAAIRGDPKGSLGNWNSSDENPCSWNGITCREGSVVALSLPKKKLVGYLPSALGSLQSLRHVNLRSNRLFGSLPADLFAARGLERLVLFRNFLSGSIPLEIGELLYLQSLDLSSNFFSGSMPRSLVQCKRLKALVLSHNNFTSSLPLGFGSSLVGLEKLDLSYNGLSGPIPGDIGNLPNLQGTLDLSHNRFSGFIPPSLGNLPEKVFIDLTYNNLSGPIPQNGALKSRGPMAYVGNPDLCGTPLQNPCPSDVLSPKEDDTHSGRSSSEGLSNAALIAIVVSDVLGIGLIALLFYYFYRKAIASLKTKEEGERSDKGLKGRKECMCFTKESDALSENIEQYELVPLDKHVTFDLDELLKGSAFVLGKSEIGIVYRVVLNNGLALAVRRLGEGGLQRFKEFQTEDSAPLSWEVRLKIMKGVAKGLAFLHEFSPKKYVHGDLKPNNVLLGLNMEPYISDFGVGRLANLAGGSPFLQSDRVFAETTAGQQSDVAFGRIITKGSCYQAPEVLRTMKPSQKWDVYSYGAILLELISGKSPLVLLETTEMDLVRWVQFCIEEKRSLLDVLDPFLAQEIDREDEIVSVLKIALACVQANPEMRPSMRHVADTLERLIN
ncbi:hypothetical protein B296_00008572 [Ensete ventricosum]|uniref:Protein kinase domain-containing protein n=1 Tax=Ensete ventricosum TaxID=4639 RepID=A0A427BB09_ENSVE|nr:hypothetical protein B296_00008572 [Ensete ventricosum]